MGFYAFRILRIIFMANNKNNVLSVNVYFYSSSLSRSRSTQQTLSGRHTRIPYIHKILLTWKYTVIDFLLHYERVGLFIRSSSSSPPRLLLLFEPRILWHFV